MDQAKTVEFPNLTYQKLNAKNYIDALYMALELDALGNKYVNKEKLISNILSDLIRLLPHMAQIKGTETASSLLNTERFLLALQMYFFHCLKSIGFLLMKNHNMKNKFIK